MSGNFAKRWQKFSVTGDGNPVELLVTYCSGVACSKVAGKMLPAKIEESFLVVSQDLIEFVEETARIAELPYQLPAVLWRRGPIA